MLTFEVRTTSPAPPEAEIDEGDPNVEMLDAAAINKLRTNGITGGGSSLFIDALDRIGYGNQINGGAFRRDTQLPDVLHLDLYVAAPPDEIRDRSSYSLVGVESTNPWPQPGKSPLQTTLSEHLAVRAPKGKIRGMVSEVKAPRQIRRPDPFF